MILIADSGSTKTDWRILTDKHTIISFKTAGFNPYFTDAEKIRTGISAAFPAKLSCGSVATIFFYGAGCSSKQKCGIISNALETVFPNAEIVVNHDMLGAARALFGRQKGVAVILGTGANTCQYDGAEITDNITSLGYILGDEGSGAYLGTKLLKSYLEKTLPADILDDFDKTYGLSKDDILNAVYKGEAPNRFIASFTPFLSAHLSNTEIKDIIAEGFNQLFTKHICKYTDYDKHPIRFTGSISSHFADILRQTGKKHKVSIDRIEEYPINGLIEFHKKLVNK